MSAAIETTSTVFRAFADETRLRLLSLLAGGELCVCDLCEVLGVLQPSISRHLAYLQRAGLVRVRREGKWKYYSIADDLDGLRSSLVSCMKCCLEDLDVLRRDRQRLQKARKGGCCPPSECLDGCRPDQALERQKKRHMP